MTGGSECAGYSHPTETISEYIQKKLVDITKLEIKIYDELGRIIDINNADYSFTLELDLIYDL